ncbi:MAG TPA: YecR family lipoprotein [Candidatus Binatia bacterium]
MRATFVQLKYFVLALLMTGLVGCAVQKQWTATGGSRSDGIVKLSYEYRAFERPQTDQQQGLELAIKRCGVWGYTGAEAFGGQTRACNNTASGTCNSWLVTREYQCTGTGQPNK